MRVRTRWYLLAGSGAVLVVIGVLYVLIARRLSSPPPPPDPRATFPSPYLNVRPGVAYVGDESCHDCHPSICSSYAQHPMGRSLSRVDHPGATGSLERYGPEAHAEFEKFGARYGVEIQDGRMVHIEETLDRSGAVATRVTQPMAYAIGSGTHAHSYLFERQGAVFQSPITWYTEAGRWDGSPGYAPDWHFNRPAPPDCLFCHANAVEPIEGTVNRYAPPLFRGLAIGCERCHGPGSLHVSRQESGGATENTLVNPSKLEPRLRDAVCEQCHLSGRARVLKDGRGLFDYRPGLPLHLFWSVFEFPTDLEGSVNRVAGHTEQMHASRCYVASAGRLGCISCHDPHSKPAATKAAGIFRDACLKCHTEEACSAPRSERRATRPADNCAGCHMPRSPTAGVGHVALTDHRIQRRPAAPVGGVEVMLQGRDSLVLFHRDLVPQDDPGVERDLGIALVTLARLRSAEPGEHLSAQEDFSKAALPLLKKALARRPGDVPARDALGRALWALGRKSAALNEFQSALERAPGREYTLLAAAELADQLGHKQPAREYAEKAVAVDPVSLEAQAFLAHARAEAGDWQGAVEAATAALDLDPTDAGIRSIRIQGYLRTGHPDQARADYQLLARTVPEPDVLLRWYTQEGGVP